MLEKGMMRTESAGVVDGTNPSEKGLWNRLLLSPSFYLIPYLPDFINKVLDIPSQIMENGYGVDLKKGDFNLKFGRDVFSSVKTEEVHSDD